MPSDLYAPKRPWRSAWARVEDVAIHAPDGRTLKLTNRWLNARAGLLVVSSVDHAEFRGVKRPQYHVSISVVQDAAPGAFGFRRPNDLEVAMVLRDFGMVGAEEDNHEPGRARHFWRLCQASPDEAMGCECKETEEVVVEADGHRWSRERGVDG